MDCYLTRIFHAVRYLSRESYDLTDEARNTTITHMDVQQPKLLPRYRNDEDISGTASCRRTSWRSKIYPVRKHFHEQTLERHYDGGAQQDYKVNFRGHGYFRDSWLLARPDYLDAVTSTFVWKSIGFKEHFEYDHQKMYEMQREAIIMERLTASARIVDIYGHCGTSIFAESMEKDVTPTIVQENGYMKQSDLEELEKRCAADEQLDYIRKTRHCIGHG